MQMNSYSNAALDDEFLATGHADTSPRAAPDAGRPVRELEALCAKHNLARGSARDLAPFLRALDENKLLAMNFWSVVARLTDSSHGLGLTPAQSSPPSSAASAASSLEASKDRRYAIDRGARAPPRR